MYERLKTYCRATVSLTADELAQLDHCFEVRILAKKEFLLQAGQVCTFIAFIDSGTLRHFHVKEGIEKTCDISFTNSWVTDFHSFNHATRGIMNLQAMENTRVLLITKANLQKLYRDFPAYETFGRLMAERVAQRATDIAMSLSADKPEERFQKLLRNQPDLFQRVPQKYIANFLGISPESLSRLQKRILTRSKS